MYTYLVIIAVQKEIDRKPEFSDEAWALIQGLLLREPEKRLGGSKADAMELIEQSFFKDIDWSKIINK